jgi:hypothetical protein
MRTNMTTATIYVPAPEDASAAEKWDIVCAALRVAGVQDIRRPPMKAQNFQPRHARPALLSSAEV